MGRPIAQVLQLFQNINVYPIDITRKESMKKILALILTLFCSVVFAKNVQFESTKLQNELVELYTSEGCSSCPPADNWLRGFIHHPQLFKAIFPIAFHVDYWDYIGWQDRFADKEYSNIQAQHYREDNISQVYTPQLIVSGSGNRDWSYRLQNSPSKNIGILKANIIDDTAHISFNPTKETGAITAHVALLGFDFVSEVTAGENENATLRHDFVVLGYDKKSSNVHRFSIKLPKSKIDSEKRAVTIWVTQKNSLKPLQVIGGWI